MKYKVIKSNRIEISEERKDTVLYMYWLENITTKQIIKIDGNLNYEVGVVINVDFKITD